MRALRQSLLLCATLVALASPPAARAGGVIDNVLTQWRAEAAQCEDATVRFPEAPMHVAADSDEFGTAI